MRPSVRYNSHRPWRFRRWLDRHESAKEWAPFEAPTICAQRSPCGTWSRSSIWGTVKLDTPQARTPLRPQKIWRSGAICFKVCEASQTGDEQKKINNSTYPRAAQWGGAMIDDVPRSQVWGFIALSGIVTFAIIAGSLMAFLY